MKRKALIKGMATFIPSLILSRALNAAIYTLDPVGSISFTKPPFSPTWDSLKNYKVPEWDHTPLIYEQKCDQMIYNSNVDLYIF
jgi:hypothetical protein